MRILVMDPHVDEQHTDALCEAGHEVVRCHEEGDTHLCSGMPGAKGCPIDDGVDVAVTRPSSDAGNASDGVRCAVRRFIPLVAVVNDGEDTLVDTVDGAVPVVCTRHGDDLGDAVATAVGAPLARHGALASAELTAVLRRQGLGHRAAEVIVRREATGLRAEMRPGVDLTNAQAQGAAVRVNAALRAYDDAALSVSVLLVTSQG